MKQPLDVPKLTPTPIENDSIFNKVDIEPVEEPARKKDLLDIALTVLKGATALATGFLLGLAMAWYLYAN